jgi:hypothetical protein
MVGFSNSWGAEVQGKLVLVNVELWSVVCWQIFAGLTTSNKTTFAKNKIYKHGERLKVEINILFMEKTYEPLYSQLNIVFEMEWYMVNYHTGTSFCSWISYRHLSVHVYYIHVSSFSFFWLYIPVWLLRSITALLNFHFEHSLDTWSFVNFHFEQSFDTWGFVQWNIVDTPASFIWIIIFFHWAIKYGDGEKFWVYAGINAEPLCV